MSRINLTGTIVPSYYDTDGMREYIEKGLIIPESAFKRMLDQASTEEPLEIYVNSPGGSVFSGYEMKNMVTRWQMDTGQKVQVTVGAMAASAASTFLVTLGAPAQAHANAKFMFHGASTIEWGGKEVFEDTAKLLGSINAEVMERLTGKHGIAPETVREWFAEGRMGWLTAEEAKGYGIVGEIVEETAEALRFSDLETEQLGQNGLAVAALMDSASEGGEEGDPEDEPESEEPEPEEPEPEEPETDEPEAESADDEPEGDMPTPEQQENAIEQIRAEAVAAAVEPLNQEIARQEKALDKLNSALDRKQETIDNINAELKAANMRLNKVSPTRGAASQPGGADGEIGWKDALAKCEGDYVKARKEYPKTFAQFLEQANQ